MEGPDISQLQVTDLSVRSKTTAAPLVSNVAFTIRRGEVLGIVGTSGSGKSLTCLAMLGLLEPSLEARGRITIDGRILDLADASAARRLRGNEISLVFQEPRASLNPVRSIGSHFDEVLRRHTSLGSRDRWKRALELLDAVRIPSASSCLGSYSHELSGGQCQRVAIALALASEPKYLIADEPTTALDMTVQAQILDLIDELRTTRGLALILISHDLALVSEVAAYVVVMHEGQVVEAGVLADIAGSPQSAHTSALLAIARRKTSDPTGAMQIGG